MPGYLFFPNLIDNCFGAPLKRQQIRYGIERWSHHSGRLRIGLVVQPKNEQSSGTNSWLPLYVSNDTTNFRTLTCGPETDKRSELNVPFRKELPKTSLVSTEDTRCIFPDTTHMITRCLEADFRKMAQKSTDDMHPHKKFAIQHFEEKLTRREFKNPFFSTSPLSRQE